ncbi:MAG TPA: hypothetical protein EYG89_06525 [Bacteroidia bacterium]|nr:hypothetical protein [Bacteroidia bacterium]
MNNEMFIECDSKKDRLFLATSNLSDYKVLEEYLRKEGYSGLIHIDYLLKLGCSTNRFIQIYFDGKEFNKKSVTVSMKPSEISAFTKSILKYNINLLENSILSRKDKKTIGNLL